MLPACVVIASVAVFAGISGATLLLPLFFLLFPAFGVQALTLPPAVGASLFLQVSAFGLAVYRYARRGLVRWDIVRGVGIVSVPAAVLGAVVAPVIRKSLNALQPASGLVAAGPMMVVEHPQPPVGDILFRCSRTYDARSVWRQCVMRPKRHAVQRLGLDANFSPTMGLPRWHGSAGSKDLALGHRKSSVPSRGNPAKHGATTRK